MKKPAPAAVVAIRISTDNLKAIDALAKRQNSSRTAVITNAFIAYVASNAAPPKPVKSKPRRTPTPADIAQVKKITTAKQAHAVILATVKKAAK